MRLSRTSFRWLAALQALACGGVGALIRSVCTDLNRLGHTGSQGADPAKLPAAALSVPDAELLHRLLAKGPVRLHLELVSREEVPVESANVVGEVRGVNGLTRSCCSAPISTRGIDPQQQVDFGRVPDDARERRR